MKLEFLYLLSALFQGIISGLPKSCMEIKEAYPYAQDGEYLLNIHHKNNDVNCVKMYCHGMDAHPSEYLTLPAGDEMNFAITGRNQDYHAETFFKKIAIGIGAITPRLCTSEIDGVRVGCCEGCGKCSFHFP